MTTAIIPVLVAMHLGSTFDLVKYEKGSADVFDERTLEGNLRCIDRSFTRSQYKLVETSTQAREFLDVSGALSLRIKNSPNNNLVEGTGTYLKDTANRQKFVELLIRVQHETVTETIPSHLKPRREWMNMSPDLIGTHYVRSITYGGELIASFRLKANNSEEREKIKAAITANLQLSGTFDLNATGSFDKLRKDLAGMYKAEIKVMATKSPSSPPQTVEHLMQLVEDYPKEISTLNGGKGKAIKAELFPLTSLKEDYPNYFLNSALNSLLDDVETKYDDIRTVTDEIRKWNDKRIITSDDDDEEGNTKEDKLVYELISTHRKALDAFHLAISKMDVSMKGAKDQFDKAFEAYGTGKQNIPNRFQRWFWKLRHEITKEKIVWEKPAGSGEVYINWGSETCAPSSSTSQPVELLYSGLAGGPMDKVWVGGRNYECMKLADPQLSGELSMQPKPALLDAVEYRSLVDPEKAFHTIPCAACRIPETVALETFYAQTSCPDNWNKEYSGLTMATLATRVGEDLMCLNKKVLSQTTTIQAGSKNAKMNPVWMKCETCDGEKIVPCVVCSYQNKAEL